MTPRPLALLIALGACNGSPPDTPQPPSSTAPVTSVEPVAPVPAPTVSPSAPAPAASATDLKADGAACSQGTECASGVCEGPGCGTDAGTCAPATRRCKRDRRPFCACDGETFYAGSNCPGRLFEKAGPCEEKP